MGKGLLIVLSGPSGVGKGTVRKYITENFDLDFVYSVSMTTREIRQGETDGVDYYFVSNDEFDKRIKNDEFLEWAEFVGNRYGTPKDKIENLRNEGKNVFLEIEINGAAQVLNKVHDNVISFFLVPPDLKALEYRIRNRRTECEEVIQERLTKAKKEMTMTEQYDFVIVNNKIDETAKEIVEKIKTKMKEIK